MISCNSCKNNFVSQRALSMHIVHSKFCMDRRHVPNSDTLIHTSIAVLQPVNEKMCGVIHQTNDESLSEELSIMENNCNNFHGDISLDSLNSNSIYSESQMYHENDVIHEICLLKLLSKI